MTSGSGKKAARKAGASAKKTKTSTRAGAGTKSVKRSGAKGAAVALKQPKDSRKTSAKRAATGAAAPARTGSRRQGATSQRRQRHGATTKRTISFDTNVLVAAEELAGSAAGGNLSAVVNDAVAHHVRLLEFGMLLAELEKELGPVSPKVHAEVEAAWQD